MLEVAMKVVSRRSMLKLAGGAGVGFGLAGKVFAVLDNGIVSDDDVITADKKLSASWKKSLTDRGAKEVWSGKALETIGMPIGGIAAGQLYLCGDGSLGCWELFNYHQFLGWGATSYAKRAIEKPVEFGFEIAIDGKKYALDKAGFATVAFEGRYPIGKVSYSDPGHKVVVRLEAFSPFVPTNSHDSALPATIFEFAVTNFGTDPCKVAIAGHLQNVVAKSGDRQPGTRLRSTRVTREDFLTAVTLSADPAEDAFGKPVADPLVPISLATFEGEDYGGWKAEGRAFGSTPAKGTLKNQNLVSGFEGSGLVNTYLDGDDTKGRLVSPAFKIERRFINFKIGGGNHPTTCINLVIDGKVVRTSSGLNDERLLWETWIVDEFRNKVAHIEIVDNQVGPWGHINIDEIEMADTVRSRDDVRVRHGDGNRDHGSLSLSYLGKGRAPKDSKYTFSEKRVESLSTDAVTIPPGQTVRFAFALTWFFPNHVSGRNYSNWFSSSTDVAQYVKKNYVRLSEDTHKWCKTYYDSTLPYWLLDRLHSTTGNLSSGTTEWWKNGRFWAWEGVVSCHGTCTHVWNYEHTLARLFPDIERNVRIRQDFGEGFDEKTGLVGFRGAREYATDGQCGTILKTYREHRGSADNSFLSSVWPRAKRALEFVISQDPNGDGLIENAQPNTYDIDFEGPNTFVGALYLAALRAGEEMAREMGDMDFATHCRELFERGREATLGRLWNGEYFIQDVDQVKVPRFQYGPGCLADQLFGQGWAHQVGLGHLYPADKVKTALGSIWTYNWTPDVSKQIAKWVPERPFADAGEAGLLLCTWPKGGRQGEPVRYRDEIWTGIEYQVAGHMIWEGMVTEGLSLCKAVHERYHPLKRNPYNEVECGDHYARALASWGVLTALGGFEYHGPKGRIGFAPRVTPENFKSVFTAAEGWGSYSQQISRAKFDAQLTLVHGKVRLSELSLKSNLNGTTSVTVDGKVVPSKAVFEGGTMTVKLEKPLDLVAGQTLMIGIVGVTD